MNSSDDPATVAQSLRLVGDLKPADFDGIVERWGSLDRRLRSFRADAVELALTVKERGTPSQKTTLEARIAGRPAMVASSREVEFGSALIEVRDDLIRQLSDAKNRTEPRNSRQRRDTGV